MSLFSVQIMDQRLSSVLLWKEKNSGQAILEWAHEQALILFPDSTSIRLKIEEDKPVVV
jgi:hypothetical protein